MKRFYKLVSFQSEPAGGFSIRLDGRPVKVPSGAVMLAPSEDMAGALVKEWAAQGEKIVPDMMPLTQILTTRIDRVSKERSAMTDALMKYLDTDLLCYRAAQPAELAKMQQESWDPFLAWFAEAFGVRPQTTTGLAALKQGAALHSAVHEHVNKMTDDVFTVLQLVSSLSGSLILGLAFCAGKITPEQVFDCAHVEERHKAAIYNEDFYGPDPAEAKKRSAMRADLEAAAVYLKLL
ncbi:MAG TPA: ATP12 chaperone family protein [Rhodospirillaceae bacterium]|nr:ATP12 chaperone family protein [Rhodospirillaceae bacterium]